MSVNIDLLSRLSKAIDHLLIKQCLPTKLTFLLESVLTCLPECTIPTYWPTDVHTLYAYRPTGRHVKSNMPFPFQDICIYLALLAICLFGPLRTEKHGLPERPEIVRLALLVKARVIFSYRRFSLIWGREADILPVKNL